MAPLSQGKSKKSFEKNFKTELAAGKPKDQSLAISYAVQRKNKKKMAKGGPIQAGSEKPTADSGETHACTYMCNNEKHYNDKGELVHAGSERPTADSHEEGVEHASKPHDADVELVRGDQMRPTADTEENYNDGESKEGHAMSKRAASSRPTADSDEYGETEMLAEGGDVEGEDEDTHVGSLAEAIAKRLAKHLMAGGGKVHDDGLDESSKEHGNFEDDLSFDALGEEQFDDDQLDSQPSDSNEVGDEREHKSEDKEDNSLIGKIRKRNKK